MPIFNVEKALASGKSEDEILSYLSKRNPTFKTQEALKSKSKREIINYLSINSKESIIGLGGDKKYIENPYMEETKEISTITAKPIMKPSENDWYRPAGMSTMAKAGFVDNNEKRIDIFAKARGISPDKYEIKDGKIWFEGPDGRMYPEAPKEIGNLIKKFAAELPSELPADIGATIGAIGGSAAGPGGTIAGGAGGAAIGEAARKGIGRIFFDDDQSVLDYAKDMGLQAIFGAFDAGFAKQMVSKLSTRKIKKETGGKLTKNLYNVVGDISPEQKIEGEILKDKGKKIGVDILPHQAMDDPTLTGYYKLLRDNPKTARAVRLNDDKLDAQVQRAGEELVRSISNKETDPFEVGQALSDVGLSFIEKMKAERSAATKGLYKIAEKDKGADFEPVLRQIEGLKTNLKPDMAAFKSLNRIKRMLLKEEEYIVGKNKKKIMVPEDRIGVIDNIKKEIDAILEGKDAPAIKATLKAKMASLKDSLTQIADETSPSYAAARAKHAEMSPRITRAENGILGTLANLRNEKTKEDALRKVFASERSIRIAKSAVEKTNPELWNDVVAELFRSEFDKASKVAQGSGGSVLNRPGKYTSRMWDISNQKKLRIATKGMKDGNGEPLYKRISDFFDVMKKASIGQGKESATQTRLKMEKDLQGIPGRLNSSMMDLRQAALNFGLGKSQDRAFDRNAKKLLELMQTPEGVDLIAKAKGYGPRTEKGMIAATTLLLMATESNAKKASEIIRTYQDE